MSGYSYATEVRESFEKGRAKSGLVGGVGLEYIAEASYYHATVIEGFEGTLAEWVGAVARRPRNAYEEKQEAKRERLAARAEKADAEAVAARSVIDRISSVIPLGQPVLVGHHSEKRHRRDLEKMDRAMGKSVEASKKADDLRRRAESVGTAGVSSDDPEAIAKLKAKLDEAKRRRDFEVRANKAVREYAKRRMKVLGVESLSRDDHLTIAGLLEADGFPVEVVRDFKRLALTFPWLPQRGSNLGREVARLEKRIPQLEAAEGTEARPTLESVGSSIVDDKDDNRVRIVFDSKPPPEKIAELKRAGFKWSPSNGAWQRQRSNQAWYAACRVIGVDPTTAVMTRRGVV